MTRLQLLAFVVGFLSLCLTLGAALTHTGLKAIGPAVVLVAAVVLYLVEEKRKPPSARRRRRR